MPALRALRRALGGHRLVLAGTPALLGAAQAWDLVDEAVPTVPWEPPAGADVPDLAVNLQGEGPRHVEELAALGPRLLVTFGAPELAGPGRVVLPWVAPDLPYAGEHQADRWLRLVRAGVGADRQPGDSVIVPPETVPEPGVPRGSVVLHPGATSGARRWPGRQFSEVAAVLGDRGIDVVVTAGPGEERLAEAVVFGAVSRRVRAWAPESVVELSAGLARASAVVVGDTGVGHLAAALRVPAVHLYGPSDPAEWGPFDDRAHRRVLHPVLYGDPTDPHARATHPALLRITPDDVLTALDDLLGPALVTASG
ncbi:MAG: glycosyltransferase family 9 protein [Kineosporiaceae bacterium]